MKKLKIDDVTHAVEDYNHSKSQSIKSQIVISFSQRLNDYHITRLKHKEFGQTKKWNMFTVGRNGQIFQHFDSKYYSDFIGVKDVDKQSISIVVENMGYLVESSNGEYVNWLNEICDYDKVSKKKFFGYEYWECVTNEQVNNLASLCNQLCEIHEIPKKCINFTQYHKDILNYKGIVFRSNYVENCVDINPTFNIDKFNELLIDNI